MDKVLKSEFVKQLEYLLRLTSRYSTIRLKYGYLDDNKFIESERNLSKPNDPREMVQISFDDIDEIFHQSVEMDNCYSILTDITSALKRLS